MPLPAVPDWLLSFLGGLVVCFVVTRMSERSMDLLLSLLGVFFSPIANLNFSKVCQLLKIEEGGELYVACPACHTLYSPDDCVNRSSKLASSRTCSHKAAPDEPMCGSPLLGNNLKPFKEFRHFSITGFLRSRLQCARFREDHERWLSMCPRQCPG
jgi:hypothetical protein